MVKSWRNSATCSWEWFRRSSKIGGCFVMGIVIRLLRHIPAYLLLTYTDERNPKMFHGLRRFVPRSNRQIGLHGDPDSVATRWPLFCRLPRQRRCGRGAEPRGCQSVELVFRECQLFTPSFAISGFPPAGFLV